MERMPVIATHAVDVYGLAALLIWVLLGVSAQWWRNLMANGTPKERATVDRLIEGLVGTRRLKMLHAMLSVNPSERPTFAQILDFLHLGPELLAPTVLPDILSELESPSVIKACDNALREEQRTFPNGFSLKGSMSLTLRLFLPKLSI